VATLLIRIRPLEAGDDARVEQALLGLPGVFGVVVSPAAGRAEIDIEDDEVGIDRILDALRDAGFEARLAG
jgi:copper chaperone CopZ